MLEVLRNAAVVFWLRHAAGSLLALSLSPTQAGRQADRQAGRQTDRQTDRRMDGQVGRQTDSQLASNAAPRTELDRQTKEQTDMPTCLTAS